MEFGAVPLKEALGAILAHSEDVEGGRLRKGLVLEQVHLDRLAASGVHEVVVARLDPDDVHEDKAAEALARSLVADGEETRLRLGKAGTGRCNIFADAPGVVQIDADAIHAVNSVDPMITVSTVPPYQRMTSGGMVATVKIISYGVRKQALEQARQAARNALCLATARLLHASFIETTIGAVSDKGAANMQARLAALGAQMEDPVRCPHDTDALARTLSIVTGDLILILTASATSDIRDTAPEALRKAGGTVSHFGMPVDPGNLLFLGELYGRPVIGLPGCARSPALNGADWVLERLVCGIPVTAKDIMGMGVGGLLKEIPTRPQPRNPKPD